MASKARAYAEQARADYDAYIASGETVDATIGEHHRLQLLQVALEKLAESGRARVKKGQKLTAAIRQQRNLSMKNAGVAVFLLLVCAVSGLAAAQTIPSTSPTRKSADGVEFPSISVRDPQLKFALLGNIFGSDPSTLGKVWSGTKSRSILTHHVRYAPSPDWFVLDRFGADAVGFDLIGGRISHVVLMWYGNGRIAKDKILADLRNNAKENSDSASGNWEFEIPGTFRPLLITVSETENTMTFDADWISWYLATNDIPNDIASAMQSRNVIKGMTESQMRMMFGSPEETTQTESGKECRWKFYTEIPIEYPPGTFVGEQTDPLFQGSGGNDAPQMKRVITRIVDVVFINDKIASFEDKKIAPPPPRR